MTELNAHSIANGKGRTVPHVNGKATYAEKHKVAEHFVGGNRLENAPPSKVKEFVASHDGHTVITNVSILCCVEQLLAEADGYVVGPYCE
jgi:acetyl-CoA carboxylase/biotin carboxylase 1